MCIYLYKNQYYFFFPFRISHSFFFSINYYLLFFNSLAVCYLAMNLRISSIKMTGSENTNTNFQSLKSNGTVLKIFSNIGIYRIQECRARDVPIANNKTGFANNPI